MTAPPLPLFDSALSALTASAPAMLAQAHDHAGHAADAAVDPASTSAIWSAIMWFSGGEIQYHTLYHCFRGDIPWIVITVLLDLAVAAGYVLIAWHWYRNQRHLPPIPAKRALANMRNIFVFCGICGYLFIPIKLFWPAWRLYDIFMLVLVYFTWRYAWGARDLKVVYSELGRSGRLAVELEESRQESRRKSQFLNAISHDLRTPLNGLMLQAQLAQLRLASPAAGEASACATNAQHTAVREDVAQSLGEICRSAQAASDMLERLLEFARLDFAVEPNLISAFSVGELVHEVIGEANQKAADKGLVLRAACSDQLFARTDRTKLRRILSSLVDNAIKYTPRGEVRLEAAGLSTGLEIHVIDTGIGIGPDAQQRLFDEFYQVENHERDRSKGFGLGLSITRRLARQLGGDVEVESAPGRGSTFTVLIPNDASAHAAQRTREVTKVVAPALAGNARE